MGSCGSQSCAYGHAVDLIECLLCIYVDEWPLGVVQLL